MARIVWTGSEWRKLAGWFTRNGVDVGDRGLSGHLKQAMQAELPRDRWRDLSNGNTGDARRRLCEAQELRRLLDNEVVTTKPEEPTLTLAGYSTEALRAELDRRRTDQLVERLGAELRRLVAEALRPLTVVEPSERPLGEAVPQHWVPRRQVPRVLVVGPLPAQQRELMRTTLGAADLRFVASDEKPDLVPARGAGVEHVVLWTNYVNHAHQAQAKGLKGELHYVTGGMSSLREKVLDIVCRCTT